jgi:hypothetical protein
MTPKNGFQQLKYLVSQILLVYKKLFVLLRKWFIFYFDDVDAEGNSGIVCSPREILIM